MKNRMQTAFLAAAMCLGLAHGAHAQSMATTAEAVDGDTLKVPGYRIKLAGIDAPELAQTCKGAAQEWACGAAAHDYLADMVTRKKLQCDILEKGPKRWLIASCAVDGIDLAEQMIRSGLAVAIADTGPDHALLQEKIRQLEMGIWATEFEMPDVWRTNNPPAAPADQPKNPA